MDPFLLETLKHPLSAPFLILLQIALLIYIFIFVKSKIIKEFTSQYLSTKSRIIAIIILYTFFFSSVFLLFFKMTSIPEGSYETDDGSVVISAFLIKNELKDSTEKILPYYPYFNIKIHKENYQSLNQRGIPMYFQIFTQYFTEPGFFSLRLECTLLMLITSVSLFLSMFLITENITYSTLCASLFNILPWTKVLSRITPETTSYCYASGIFLLSIFFLVKYKNKLGIVFYIVSLLILYLSYAPGLLLAPLCGVIIPLILFVHSKDYKKTGKSLFFFSMIFLFLVTLYMKDDLGLKSSLERAQGIQGLAGVSNFDFNALYNTLSEKAKFYTANFIAYLLPQFLFINGDANSRHNCNTDGQLFIVLGIAFYLGLFSLIWKRDRSLNLTLLLVFLLLSIIPASICLEGSLEKITQLPLHSLRASSALPPITIISVLGLIRIIDHKAGISFLYVFFLILNIFSFYNYYFYTYPNTVIRAFDDRTLKESSALALYTIKQQPQRKLFYSTPFTSLQYHNAKTIGTKSILNGDGLLSNVYNFEERGDIKIEPNDIILVHEPWPYDLLKGYKYDFIKRFPNPKVHGGFGSSVLVIIK